MESFNLFKFWRNPARSENVAVNAVIDYVNSDYNNKPSPETEYDSSSSSSSDDSLFELELNTTKNNFNEQLVESPRDVFRNGRVFPLDSPLSSSKPQSPISLPKFKVFMLGFKKSKPDSSKPREIGQSTRFSSVEEMPVLSRDNSLRTKLLRENMEDLPKRSEKDVLKYLKAIKPLFSMASKRFNNVNDGSPVVLSPASSPRKVSVEKQTNRSSGFKNVGKSLGKSKSAAGMSPSPSPVHRRDDSLLQDGIQGAILHCKRSYNTPAKELSRCASDPSYEKSVTRARDSELMKRSSI